MNKDDTQLIRDRLERIATDAPMAYANYAKEALKALTTERPDEKTLTDVLAPILGTEQPLDVEALKVKAGHIYYTKSETNPCYIYADGWNACVDALQSQGYLGQAWQEPFELNDDDYDRPFLAWDKNVGFFICEQSSENGMFFAIPYGICQISTDVKAKYPVNKPDFLYPLDALPKPPAAKEGE